MNQDVLGKYIHQKTGTNYLELKPEGNYFLFEGDTSVTGSYEVNGSEITFFGTESAVRVEFQDGVIIDSEGDHWIRTTATKEAAAKPTKCNNCNSDVLETAKFCSNCGAQVGAPGEVSPAHITRQVRNAPAGITNQAKASTRDSTTAGDETLASVSWLPAVLRRDDFPWELIEAGLVVVIFILFVVAIRGRP